MMQNNEGLIIIKKERITRKNTYKCFAFIFTLVIIAIFSSIFVLKKYIYPLTHFDIVKEAAKENSIDPYLILAIIKTESGFNATATSNKEAKGLMQILNSTANDMNEKINIVEDVDENIFDANVNIKLGCEYFSTLLKKYDGNYYLAICAYNAGMGNVDKWLDSGIISKDLKEYKDVNLPFKETSNYLNKVVSSYKIYKRLYG